MAGSVATLAVLKTAYKMTNMRSRLFTIEKICLRITIYKANKILDSHNVLVTLIITSQADTKLMQYPVSGTS
jgi:hypothetical protein